MTNEDKRFLWDYCTATAQTCSVAKNNCEGCSEQKKAEEYKRKGEPQRPIAKK